MLNMMSAVAAIAVGFALVTPSAQAAELLVLGSQGNISGLRDLAAGFERASGHKVVGSQERNVMDKVNANAPADVVSGNPPVIEELKARTKFLDGFPAAEAVARGEVEIALQQINVILPVKGAELAGALPAELQQYNHFAVGVLAVSKEREAATALVSFMGAPENEALVRKSGLEPPAR